MHTMSMDVGPWSACPPCGTALDLVPLPINATESSGQKWPHLADGLQGTAGGFVSLRVALRLQAECLGEDRSRDDPPKEPCMAQGLPTSSGL